MDSNNQLIIIESIESRYILYIIKIFPYKK